MQDIPHTTQLIIDSPSNTNAQAQQHKRVDTPVIGIVGLGLIGGSFARAYAAAGWTVYAEDPHHDTFAAASIETISGELSTNCIAQCDLIILATYPQACIDWLNTHAHDIGTHPVVIDAAGTKRELCTYAFELASRVGFSFCGAHPMAGKENSGFAHARADLFQGAPMVLVPPALPDIERLNLLDRIHQLLKPAGFAQFSVTTPEKHDRIIAFTSQLAHVVSNAYVKSPTAAHHHGFSAGSYKDLTRVAHLNPTMWSELMMTNRDDLLEELDVLIASLRAYRDALDSQDVSALYALLAEGDTRKRALDGSKTS
ncbi:prephenate dehydrogenase/arogenate dehydrogenase family protein [Collinsella sp. zg1085]|uniref:prephenate dehydrogenase n=1 Tax=Collinsella sp. zg1085 TaxID=2844380 RepID=UPI001C0B3691|nr:prephenate dehydrogenase/arogenate dehydrogenase family protein [Collinsella sp. zg1085]QWT17068.1 prephenate dehydrogenase/arogenate dehydrogenase family protein [Collinsella sp. zg1085]